MFEVLKNDKLATVFCLLSAAAGYAVRPSLSGDISAEESSQIIEENRKRWDEQRKIEEYPQKYYAEAQKDWNQYLKKLKDKKIEDAYESLIGARKSWRKGFDFEYKDRPWPFSGAQIESEENTFFYIMTENAEEDLNVRDLEFTLAFRLVDKVWQGLKETWPDVSTACKEKAMIKDPQECRAVVVGLELNLSNLEHWLNRAGGDIQNDEALREFNISPWLVKHMQDKVLGWKDKLSDLERHMKPKPGGMD